MGNKRGRNKKSGGAFLLRDWIFERMVEFLIRGEFEVDVVDFEKLPDLRDRELLGLTDYEKNKIFLNIKGGATYEILIHELGHVFFDDMVDDEARELDKKENEKAIWSEDRILEFEDRFCASLTRGQKKAIQDFIDEIKKKRA